MQAGKRIGFFLFVALNAYAVLFPRHVTWAANLVGIGRGADLVLYLLVVAFVFGMLNTYLRFRGANQQLTELARTVALREAELVNRQRGILEDGDVHDDDSTPLAGGADADRARPRGTLVSTPAEPDRRNRGAG